MSACSGVESRRRGPRLLRAACGTLSPSSHACDLRVSYARQEKGVALNSSASGALRSEVPAPAHPTRSPFSTPLNLITTHLIVEHNPRSPPAMPASTPRRAHMSLASLPEARRAVGERPHGEPNRRISGSASKKRVWHPHPARQTASGAREVIVGRWSVPWAADSMHHGSTSLMLRGRHGTPQMLF